MNTKEFIVVPEIVLQFAGLISIITPLQIHATKTKLRLQFSCNCAHEHKLTCIKHANIKYNLTIY